MLLQGSKLILVLLYILIIFLILLAIVYHKTFVGQSIMILILFIILLEIYYIFVMFPNDDMCSLSNKMWCINDKDDKDDIIYS